MSAEPAPARGPTKQALIIGLLQRQEGATLADLVAATGWLPHTTRAALTRLRQAGHLVDKTKGETSAVYRIATAPRANRSRKAA
jgi:DNA-binding transcriptional regulator PaaX